MKRYQIPGGSGFHSEPSRSSKKKRCLDVSGCALTKGDYDDAVKALVLEKEYAERNTTAPTLLLQFPDLEITSESVRQFSSEIDLVSLTERSMKRSCLVRLKENANVRDTIEAISKVPFGNGYLSAEQRSRPTFISPSSLVEELDAKTIFLGNLPCSTTSQMLNGYFPDAHRIIIGPTNFKETSRNALIGYCNAERAREAFKKAENILIAERPVIVHFQRQRYPLLNPIKSIATVIPPPAERVVASTSSNILKSMTTVHSLPTDNKMQYARLHGSVEERNSPRAKVPKAENLSKIIKQESSSEEEELHSENNANSLLGLRYHGLNTKIKREPEDENEEKGSEGVGADTNSTKSSFVYFQNLFGSDSDDGDVPILKISPLESGHKNDEKKIMNVMNSPRQRRSKEQSAFVKSLYDQVRKAKKTEGSTRTRGEAFDKLSSNSDEDDDEEDLLGL